MKLMDRLYDNLDEAKAFVISFTNFVDIYDDMCLGQFSRELCDFCGKFEQVHDYVVPKANCKKPYGILSSCEMGVSIELRDELIEHFDITEKDFRPIVTKKGEIVYYQITPQHTMLPLHKQNNWVIENKCPKCGSVQYSSNEFINEKGEFYYFISKEALDDIHDLNCTYERFGCYKPDFVISRRVYEFLTDKYPRTHFFPFFLKQE